MSKQDSYIRFSEGRQEGQPHTRGGKRETVTLALLSKRYAWSCDKAYSPAHVNKEVHVAVLLRREADFSPSMDSSEADP
jgi:hypothetical protein